MKPTMIVAQLKQRTMLLSGSREVQTFGSSNSGLRYSGSDADYNEGVR